MSSNHISNSCQDLCGEWEVLPHPNQAECGSIARIQLAEDFCSQQGRIMQGRTNEETQHEAEIKRTPGDVEAEQKYQPFVQDLQRLAEVVPVQEQNEVKVQCQQVEAEQVEAALDGQVESSRDSAEKCTKADGDASKEGIQATEAEVQEQQMPGLGESWVSCEVKDDSPYDGEYGVDEKVDMPSGNGKDDGGNFQHLLDQLAIIQKMRTQLWESEFVAWIRVYGQNTYLALPPKPEWVKDGQLWMNEMWNAQMMLQVRRLISSFNWRDWRNWTIGGLSCLCLGLYWNNICLQQQIILRTLEMNKVFSKLLHMQESIQHHTKPILSYTAGSSCTAGVPPVLYDWLPTSGN